MLTIPKPAYLTLVNRQRGAIKTTFAADLTDHTIYAHCTCGRVSAAPSGELGDMRNWSTFVMSCKAFGTVVVELWEPLSFPGCLPPYYLMRTHPHTPKAPWGHAMQHS